jgi:hypothetical protein
MKAEMRNRKSEMKLRGRWATGAVVGVAAVVVASVMAACVLGGCSTLDRAYRRQVTWTNAPTVQVVTNTVLVTNVVPMVLERTNVVFVTNAVSGAVAGVLVREQATNMVTSVVTNFVAVAYTNYVEVPVTNLVSSPVAEASMSAAGSLVNMFAPGLGSLLALVAGGLYHGYCQLRNRKVNEALVQGVETARAVLTTTPQGQAVDAQFVKWLMDHQKEAGVFAAVSELVDQVTDNPAAKMTAEEIAKRVQQAERGLSAATGAA